MSTTASFANSYGVTVGGTTDADTSAAQTIVQDGEFSDFYGLLLLIQAMIKIFPEKTLELSPYDKNASFLYSHDLGQGGFASVRNVVIRTGEDKEAIAYKRTITRYDNDGNLDTKRSLADAMHELRIYLHISGHRHENINGLRGIAFEKDIPGPSPLYLPSLMLDSSSFGNLLDFISDGIRMVDGPYWECCADVANGLNFLHNNGIVHGDVKCENVLVYPAQPDSRRSFFAKITDFGCSMFQREAARVSKLKGRTPLYDAPEATSLIPQEELHFSDIYSFGLMAWRVVLDGAELFDDAGYSTLDPTKNTRTYNFDRIQAGKMNGTLQAHALSTICDLDGNIGIDTIGVFCEVIGIALQPVPRERDLQSICEIFERNKVNLGKRNLGLGPTASHILRECIKLKRNEILQESGLHFGIADWKVVPEGAHKMFHYCKSLRGKGSEYKGFSSIEDPPYIAEVKRILQLAENVLQILGIESKAFMRNSIGEEAQTESAPKMLQRFILQVANEITKVNFRNLFNMEFWSACEEFTVASAKFSFNSETVRMLASKVLYSEKESIFQGGASTLASRRLDRVEGIARTGLQEPCGELSGKSSSAANFDSIENSVQLNILDQNIFLSRGLPFEIQKLVYDDICLRIRKTQRHSELYLRYLMEQAICHLVGFGVQPDHEVYLKTFSDCSNMGYLPAKILGLAVHDALGIPFAQDTDDLALSTIERLSISGTKQLLKTENVTHDSFLALIPLFRSQALDINASVTSTGDTPLLCACRSGNVKAVNDLLNAGAKAHFTNSFDESPLHWLSAFSLDEVRTIAKRLLDCGAVVDAVAKAHSSPDLVDFQDSKLISGTALHRAIAHGNKHAVLALISVGASTTAKAGPIYRYNDICYRMNPIELACFYHEFELLEIMLDVNLFYPINPTTDSEVGLLFHAVQCADKHTRMARYGSEFPYRMPETLELLSRRGSLGTLCLDGMTALLLAVITSNIDMIEGLLDVRPFSSDISKLFGGKTPLHYAILQNDRRIFELLILNKADPFQPSIGEKEKESIPTIQLAAKAGSNSFYFVRRLYEINPQISQNEKDLGLFSAFHERQYELAEYLLEQGANLNMRKEVGINRLQSTISLLGSIVSLSHIMVIETLEFYIKLSAQFKQSPDFIAISVLNDTVFHAAAASVGMLDEIRLSRLYDLLFEMFPGSSYLETRNSKGYAPLHMALLCRNPIGARKFVEAGADINSMTTIAGVPVGASVKDLLFAQFFGRHSVYEVHNQGRVAAERALEYMIRYFVSSSFFPDMKRSKSLRPEFRKRKLSRQERNIANFVEVMTLLPDSLPPPDGTALQDLLAALMASGDRDIFSAIPDGWEQTLARNLQWTNLETIRLMNHDGIELLETLGLADKYLDSKDHKSKNHKKKYKPGIMNTLFGTYLVPLCHLDFETS